MQIIAKNCSLCGDKLSFFSDSVLFAREPICKKCANPAARINQDELDIINNKIKHANIEFVLDDPNEKSVPATSLMGCGSAYYGKWIINFEGNECYVKTCYMILFMIPILPIESILIWGEKTTGFNIIFVSSERTNYRASRIKMFWPQVFNMYAIMASSWNFFVLLGSREGFNNDSEFIVWLYPLIGLLPSILYLILAKKKYYKLKITLPVLINLLINVSIIVILLYHSYRYYY